MSAGTPPICTSVAIPRAPGLPRRNRDHHNGGEAEWGKQYPAMGQAWRRAWEYVVPFFAFAPCIRKMIYTTNAVEALHRSLRKIIKTRRSFP
jgi:transposase-like protein